MHTNFYFKNIVFYKFMYVKIYKICFNTIAVFLQFKEVVILKKTLVLHNFF